MKPEKAKTKILNKNFRNFKKYLGPSYWIPRHLVCKEIRLKPYLGNTYRN